MVSHLYQVGHFPLSLMSRNAGWATSGTIVTGKYLHYAIVRSSDGILGLDMLLTNLTVDCASHHVQYVYCRTVGVDRSRDQENAALYRSRSWTCHSRKEPFIRLYNDKVCLVQNLVCILLLISVVLLANSLCG